MRLLALLLLALVLGGCSCDRSPTAPLHAQRSGSAQRARTAAAVTGSHVCIVSRTGAKGLPDSLFGVDSDPGDTYFEGWITNRDFEVPYGKAELTGAPCFTSEAYAYDAIPLDSLGHQAGPDRYPVFFPAGSPWERYQVRIRITCADWAPCLPWDHFDNSCEITTADGVVHKFTDTDRNQVVRYKGEVIRVNQVPLNARIGVEISLPGGGGTWRMSVVER